MAAAVNAIASKRFIMLSPHPGSWLYGPTRVGARAVSPRFQLPAQDKANAEAPQSRGLRILLGVLSQVCDYVVDRLHLFGPVLQATRRSGILDFGRGCRHD